MSTFAKGFGGQARTRPTYCDYRLTTMDYRLSTDTITYCVGGNAALMADTPSTPAILQIGWEKSAARLGTGTRL